MLFKESENLGLELIVTQININPGYNDEPYAGSRQGGSEEHEYIRI